MNIYIEVKNKKTLYDQVSFLAKHSTCNEPISFSLIWKTKLTIFDIWGVLKKTKGFSIKIIISPRNLSDLSLRCINAKSTLGIMYFLDRPCSTKDIKLINSTKGFVGVFSPSDEIAKELTNIKKCVVSTPSDDHFLYADICSLLTGSDRPLYQCSFSSCLGHTLYIDSDNRVSFCPKHIEKTEIGTLYEYDSIFNHEAFLKCIEESIKRRAVCKIGCPHFDKCKGGCPLESTCEIFLNHYQSISQIISECMNAKSSMSSLPFYMERAIIERSFNFFS